MARPQEHVFVQEGSVPEPQLVSGNNFITTVGLEMEAVGEGDEERPYYDKRRGGDLSAAHIPLMNCRAVG